MAVWIISLIFVMCRGTGVCFGIFLRRYRSSFFLFFFFFFRFLLRFDQIHVMLFTRLFLLLVETFHPLVSSHLVPFMSPFILTCVIYSLDSTKHSLMWCTMMKFLPMSTWVCLTGYCLIVLRFFIFCDKCLFWVRVFFSFRAIF